jgi:hypothetical protein
MNLRETADRESTTFLMVKPTEHEWARIVALFRLDPL